MSSVHVYTTSLRPAWRADAGRGGPQGEIRMLEDLTEALRALRCRIRLIPTLRAFYGHQKLQRWIGVPRRPDVLVLDPWSLQLAAAHGLIDDRDTPTLRILEWYGTPPDRIPSSPTGLRADQYLLPYPDRRHGNRWIGFVLRDLDLRPLESREALARYVRESMQVKKPQGLIWGKEPRYFTAPIRQMLAELGRHCELHITLSKERLGNEQFPGFINHGAMPFFEWRALIRESAFVIGLGDPIGGPTAIEAVAAGCTYLNPIFDPPRLINDVPGLEVRSQHPYAGIIPPPFVQPIAIDRTVEVVQAATAAIARVTHGAPDAAGLAPLLDALEPFTWRSYLGRVSAEFGLASAAAGAPTDIHARPRS